MAYLIGVILFALGLGLFPLMLYQHVRGIHPLFSWRNYTILGIIIYQWASVGRALMMNDYSPFSLYAPAWTGFQFAVLLILFTIAFSYFYRKGWGVARVVRKIPIADAEPSEFGLLVLAVVLTAMAFVGRFGVQVPLVGVVTARWAEAFGAMACGAVGWVWARRILNPGVLMLVVAVFAANGVVAVTETFGRRPLISLGLAVLWAMFFSRWRFESTSRLLVRCTAFAAAPVLLVAAYTDVRESGDTDRTAVEQVSAMARADIVSGVLDLTSGQGCGQASVWLIEAYPERYPYRHALALRYFFVQGIPRDWWEGKPDPLSTMVAKQATLQGVNTANLKVSPGIVGHIAAEGGLYILVIYALVAAFVIRLGDQLLFENSHRVLVVLVMGSCLGDVMGLARGEASAFMFSLLIGMAGAYGFALIVSKWLKRSQPQVAQWRDEAYATDHAVSDAMS